MRLKSIDLINFRSHQATRVNLDRMTFIRGLNHSGKSSIQMAIELALTGRCEATDAAGRGGEVLIRDGEAQMSIALTLNDDTVIRYNRNKAGSTRLVETAKGTKAGKMAEAWIEEHIAPIDVLTALLDSKRFVELVPIAQKNLLAAVLGSEAVTLDEGISRAMGVVPPASPVTTIKNAGQVDQLYDYYYQRRTSITKDVNALDGLEIPQGDVPPIEEMKAKLSKLEDELAAEQQKELKAQQDFIEKRSARQAAQAQLERANRDILPAATEKKYMAAIKLVDRYAELGVSLNGWENVLAANQTLLDRIQRIEGKCPTCTRAFDAGERDAIVEQLKADITEATLKTTEFAQKRADIGNPVDAAAELKRHRAAVVEVSGAKKVLDSTDIGEQPPIHPERQEAIAQLKTRIRTGTEMITTAAMEAGKHAAFAQQKKKLEAAVEQKKAVEILVDYFGPKGAIRSKLVGDKLGTFVDRLNGALEIFGYRCKIQMEPYQLLVGIASERDLPYWSLQQISESEAFRFQVALQASLASLTGVGFVVFDRADMLDGPSRGQMSQLLYESDIAQAIIIATGEAIPEAPTNAPGVRFLNLENVNGSTQVTDVAQATEATEYVQG